MYENLNFILSSMIAQKFCLIPLLSDNIEYVRLTLIHQLQKNPFLLHFDNRVFSNWISRYIVMGMYLFLGDTLEAPRGWSRQ